MKSRSGGSVLHHKDIDCYRSCVTIPTRPRIIKHTQTHTLHIAIELKENQIIENEWRLLINYTPRGDTVTLLFRL